MGTSAKPSGSGAGSSPGSGAVSGPGSGSYLESVRVKECDPTAFTGHAALAGGAVHRYVAPLAFAGNPSRSATRTASAAAGFAAGYLLQVDRRLAAGTVRRSQLSTAGVLFADVISQVGRAHLMFTDRIPAPAQLAG